MTSITEIPGDTIAGYDIVLSISQDAINKQMQMLYDHKLDTTAFRPAHPVKGGKAAPPAEYAINHNLYIQVGGYQDDESNSWVYTPETGIFGHIKAPEISFGGDETDQATITLSFQRDDSVPEGGDKSVGTQTSPDSKYYYYGGPPAHPQLRSTIINDWKMSWQVKVRKQNIESIMDDLVNKHEDPHDPTYLAPGLVQGLKSVSSKLFTVSSIFCLMEAVTMVNSFKIVDQAGKPPSLGLTQDIMNDVTKYFQGLAAANQEANTSGPGVPTPENPFVLGYGVTQSTQDLASVNPDASWQNTPACFIPSRFDLTTQKGSREGINTLNYCFLTMNTKDPNQNPDDNVSRHINVDTLHDAGNLQLSLFDMVGANGGDAIMAWSKHLFWDQFVINQLASVFWIDPLAILRNFMSARGVQNWSYSNGPSDNVTSDNNHEWRRRADFQTNAVEQPGSGLYGAELWNKGWSESYIFVQSDFTDQGSRPLPADARRSVLITATMDFHLEAHFETYAHVINPPRYRAYTGEIQLRYRYQIRLEPGAGGVWVANFVNSSDERPKESEFHLPSVFSGIGGGSDLKIVNIDDIGDSSLPSSGWGAWVANHTYNRADIFSPGDTADQLKYSLRAFSALAVEDVVKRIEAAASGLKSTVMAPGGEVFTFNGLDTNNTGRLFTHANYALGAEGTARVNGN